MWITAGAFANCGIGVKNVPMNGRFTTSLLVCSAVALAACGGDDDASPSVVSSVSDDPAGDEAEPAADATGSALDVIPIPLAPGAEAVSTDPAGEFTVVQFFVPVDRLADTIAFYDDWSTSQPEPYQRVEADSGGVSWQNDPEPGAEKQIIAVVSPLEGDDRFTVTLTIGPNE